MTDDDDEDAPPRLPGGKFYMTPQGHLRLVEEFRQLRSQERPRVVEIVAWAAGNGDRSENADYKEGKRRLREIDRRLRNAGSVRITDIQHLDRLRPARRTHGDLVPLACPQ